MYGSARGRQILQYKINPNPNTNPSSPYCIMRFIFGSRVHVPLCRLAIGKDRSGNARHAHRPNYSPCRNILPSSGPAHPPCSLRSLGKGLGPLQIPTIIVLITFRYLRARILPFVQESRRTDYSRKRRQFCFLYC